MLFRFKEIQNLLHKCITISRFHYRFKWDSHRNNFVIPIEKDASAYIVLAIPECSDCIFPAGSIPSGASTV